MFSKKNRKKQNQKNTLNETEKSVDQLLAEYYRNMTIEQRDQIDKQNEILEEIVQLSEGNRYDNPGLIISKINELAKR